MVMLIKRHKPPLAFHISEAGDGVPNQQSALPDTFEFDKAFILRLAGWIERPDSMGVSSRLLISKKSS